MYRMESSKERKENAMCKSTEKEEEEKVETPVRQIGIMNLGHTGYMDVILQQFFMCIPIRKFILSLSLDKNKLEKGNKDDWKDVNFIQQLQILLQGLQTAENLPTEQEGTSKIEHDGLRASYPQIRAMMGCEDGFDPENFVNAVKDNLNLHKPVNQPNDACHFQTRLIQKIRMILQLLDPEKERELTKLLVIKAQHKAVCQNCFCDSPFLGRNGFTIEHNFIQLNVRPRSNLQQAAQSFFNITARTNSSSPKQACDGCVSMAHEVTQSGFREEEMPQLLTFRLKRWGSDGNGNPIKIHDRYHLPDTVEIHLDSQFPNPQKVCPASKYAAHRRPDCPYCGTQLKSKQQSNNQQPLTTARAYKGICIRCEGVAKVPKNVFQTWQEMYDPDARFVQYRLVGVVVHRGTATGGRYYCFSRDRNTGRWIRFWGASVAAVSDQKMQEECFGGEIDKDGICTCAYLAYYEKVKTYSKRKDTKHGHAGIQKEVGEDNPLDKKMPAKETMDENLLERKMAAQVITAKKCLGLKPPLK